LKKNFEEAIETLFLENKKLSLRLQFSRNLDQELTDSNFFVVISKSRLTTKTRLRRMRHFNDKTSIELAATIEKNVEKKD
jgi:hypothetical protein